MEDSRVRALAAPLVAEDFGGQGALVAPIALNAFDSADKPNSAVSRSILRRSFVRIGIASNGSESLSNVHE